MEMSRLTRDGTAEPVSRGQILRHERGQGNIDFPCSVDHVQDWQPYSVDDPYSCYICDHTCRPPASHTCFFLFFLFLKKIWKLFPSICTIAVFSLYGEYVIRSFLPDGVFPNL